MSWLLLVLACHKSEPFVPPSADPEPAVAEAGETVVVEVGASAALDGSLSTGAQFLWNYGDGATSGWLDAPTASHVWTAPGHYTATLTVQGSGGDQVSDTVAVTVHWPVASVAPSASGTLAAHGRSLVAVMPDHDRLALVDRDTLALSWLSTCTEPRSVAARDGLLAVACALDEVVVYDESLTRVRTEVFPWGSAPFGVALGLGGEVWVTLQGTGKLAHWTGEEPPQFEDLGPDPRGLAWTQTGVLASRHRSAPDHGTLWRWANGATTWNLATDPGPDSDTDARGVPTYLQRMAVRPDNRTVVVGGLKANLERGMTRDSRPLTHESTTRAVARQVALVSTEGIPGAEIEEPVFDDRDLVSALAFHPRGDWLFAAFLGTGGVDIVDSYTMERVGGFHDLGIGLDGLWLSEEGDQLWVLASLSRELIALDTADLFGPQTELLRIDLNGGLSDVLSPEVLLGKQVFHTSGDPRMTASGYMSCASCHLDGDQDGFVWDFTDRGEGLRNTIDLRGRRGEGHGAIHWSANFDEIQDFEHDIRGPMAGQGFLSSTDWQATNDPLGAPKAGLSPELDALAVYLATFDSFPRSPHRPADGSSTGLIDAGRAIFLSAAAGCEDCHALPNYTDSGFQGPGLPLLHDVGTLSPLSGERLGGPLEGLDTPTLRGLHATAPYLHDGSVEKVRDLLDDNLGDLHGTTSHLDSNQLDALEAFLLSLE